MSDNLSGYAHRPIPFIARYLRQRAFSHAAILLLVITAVACSVATQYGVKFLVDTLARGPQAAGIWLAFAALISLIAADNVLWRVASWIAGGGLLARAGGVRRGLFCPFSGAAPRRFAVPPPRPLQSR